MLVFTADTCILCKICERKCPSRVISVDPEKGIWELNVMGCVSCGVCADVCPTKSITMAEEYRAPLTERTIQTYYCTPKPKKASAEGKTAATSDEPAAKKNETPLSVKTEDKQPEEPAGSAQSVTPKAVTLQAKAILKPKEGVAPQAAAEAGTAQKAETPPVENAQVPDTDKKPAQKTAVAITLQKSKKGKGKR